MNITEQKALRWLENQGYRGLVFGYRASPDFICPDGSGFEVKKSRNHTIYFGTNQFEELKKAKDVTILVFNDGDEPIAQFSFSELSDGTSQWGNIRIKVQDANGKLIRIRGNILRELDSIRGELSYNRVIEDLLVIKDSADILSTPIESPQNRQQGFLKRLCRGMIKAIEDTQIPGGK